MQLRQLKIDHYGHFHDFRLDFSATGLQVIAGRNEAGKSTLLNFLRDLLFGFPDKSSYMFSGERLEGQAELVWKSGQSTRLRRRKGRPDLLQLTDPTGNVSQLSPEEWQAKLGGAHRDLYQHVFAIGLKELADGEATLKLDGLQAALYGSSFAGLAKPQALLKQLTADAEKIFLKGGSRQLVPELSKQLTHLKKELREVEVKSEDWRLRDDAVRIAKSDCQRLSQQLTEQRQRLERCKNWLQAKPAGNEFQRVTTELQGLMATPELPAEALSQYDQILERMTTRTARLGSINTEVDRLDSELRELKPPTEWLANRTAIGELQELVQSARDASHDLPILRGEYEATLRECEARLAELMPGWSQSQLLQWTLPLAREETAEELARKRRELDLERHRQQEAQDVLEREWGELLAEEATLPQAIDLSPLQVLAEERVAWQQALKEIKRLEKHVRELEKKHQQQRLKLSPVLSGEVADWMSLVLPSRTTIQHFVREAEELSREVLAARQRLEEEESRWRAAVESLAQAQGTLSSIPTIEELKAFRVHRDEGWRLLVARYIVGQPDVPAETQWGGDNGPVQEAYPETVRQVDDYADALFQNASLVQQARLVENLRESVNRHTQRLSELKEQQREDEARWKQSWVAANLNPLSPSEMEDWFLEFESWLTLAHELAEAREELASQTNLREEIVTRLRSALADSTDHNSSIDVLWQQLQNRMDAEQASAQLQKQLKKQRAKLQKTREVSELQKASHEEQEASWRKGWAEWSRDSGWPADWSPEFATRVLSQLKTLREKARQLPKTAGRLLAMQTRIEDFQARVSELCQNLSEDLLALPAERAATLLAERLSTAVSLDERRQALQKQLQGLNREQEELLREHQRLLDERDCWRNQAGVWDDDAFREVARRSVRVLDLKKQHADLERQLRNLDDQRPLHDFLEELDQIHPEELRSEIVSLEIEIAHGQQQLDEANRQRGSAEAQLARIDGGSTAADIQARIAHAKAALVRAVDRYAPLAFAKTLLEQAIQRFEEETQPLLLARTSDLFKALTRERYSQIQIQRNRENPRDGHNSGLLVLRARDHEPLEPSALSTGTRELLYLAIRLAYIQHYSQQAEPLPVILDDVVANFDPVRTRETLETLSQLTPDLQIILLTCHPHVAELTLQACPTANRLQLPDPWS